MMDDWNRNRSAADWRGYYSGDGSGLQLVYMDEQFVPDPTGHFGSRPVEADFPGTPIMRQIPVTRAKEEPTEKKSDHPVASKLKSIFKKKLGKKAEEEPVAMASPPSAKFFLRTVDTTELPVTYPQSATLDEIRPMRRSDSFLTTVYVGKMKPKNIRVRLYANDVLEVILRQPEKCEDGKEKDQTVRITLPPHLDLHQLKTTYDGEKALCIEAPYKTDTTVEAVQQQRAPQRAKINIERERAPSVEVPEAAQPRRAQHRHNSDATPTIEVLDSHHQQLPVGAAIPAPSAALSPLITEQILSIISSGGKIHDGESFLLQVEGQLFFVSLFQFQDGYSRPRGKLRGNEFKMKINALNADTTGTVATEIRRQCSIPQSLTVIEERAHFHNISKTILAISVRVQSGSTGQRVVQQQQQQPAQRVLQQQQHQQVQQHPIHRENQQQQPTQWLQQPQQPMTVREQLNQVIQQQHSSRTTRMTNEHDRTRKQNSSQVTFRDDFDDDRGFKIYSDGRQSPVIVKR